MGEHRRNLERPDEPQPRNIGRLEISDVAPVERDPTAGRRDEFRQHVETGRLARAVRPDQRVDRPTLDAQRNVTDRAEITEALAKAFRDENIIHAHSRRSAERMRFPPMNAKVYQAAGAAVVKPKKATLRPRSNGPRPGSRRWSEAPAPLKFGASITHPSFDCAAVAPSRAPGARCRQDCRGSASSQARSSPGLP